MESPFPFRGRIWAKKKKSYRLRNCIFFLIFYFLLFWSQTHKENFVENFSGSLLVIKEQIFLQKNPRKGLIGFLALPWIEAFCHSLHNRKKKKAESRHLSYLKCNSRKNFSRVLGFSAQGSRLERWWGIYCCNVFLSVLLITYISLPSHPYFAT